MSQSVVREKVYRQALYVQTIFCGYRNGHTKRNFEVRQPFTEQDNIIMPHVSSALQLSLLVLYTTLYYNNKIFLQKQQGCRDGTKLRSNIHTHNVSCFICRVVGCHHIVKGMTECAVGCASFSIMCAMQCVLCNLLCTHHACCLSCSPLWW